MDPRIANFLKQLDAREMVIGIAMEELIALLPEDAKASLAARLRLRIDEALRERADESDMETDSAATLQLATFLEAAGHPPKS